MQKLEKGFIPEKVMLALTSIISRLNSYPDGG